MSSKIDQKRLQKKKAREEKARQIRLHNQAINTAERQKKSAEIKRIKRLRTLKRDLGEHNTFPDDVLMQLDDKTLSKLEHNVLILKELEKEYDLDQSKKTQLNQSLEQEGHQTLEQKLQAMHAKLMNSQDEINLAFKDIKPSEVAEVSIIKAADVEEVVN